MSKYSENMPPDIFGAIGWMYDYIAEGSTLLDFGCSTGYFGSYIKENKNCKVYGAEISDDKVEAAKVLDGVYSFDLDGEWPENLYERTYDYLFFGDVLEHLKDPTDALRKCKKLLKPGGKIFVSVPNIAHISIRLELLKGSFTYEPMGILDTTHLQYFTLETFKKNATNAGFEADLVDYTQNDIPQEIIEKQLKEHGLKADKKFWDMTKTLEARAYQFKFSLEVSNKKTKAKKEPIVKPLQYRDDIISNYDEQLKGLDKHSVEQAKLIKHFKDASESLERENAELRRTINNSPLRRIKRQVVGPKKNDDSKNGEK